MATTANTPSEPRPARPSLIARFRRLSTPLKIISTLVAFTVAALGLVFLIFPQLEPKLPPETASATFEDVWVDPGVTLGQYLERALLSKNPYSAEQLARRGALVTFDVRFEGYGEKGLPIRWYALDESGSIVGGRDKDDVLNVDRNNATVSYRFFVPVPQAGATYRVRIELYAPGSEPGRPDVLPLRSWESKPFVVPAG